MAKERRLYRGRGVAMILTIDRIGIVFGKYCLMLRCYQPPIEIVRISFIYAYESALNAIKIGHCSRTTGLQVVASS